jgi:spore coat polysaccharide biosynthesis protein SpsF
MTTRKKKVVAIVQARTGSTRLPGKVLKKINKKTMLEHVIERLKHAKTLNEIVIATSNKERDKPIIELAKRLNMSYFAGSEDDVLDRYLKAAEQVEAEIIVRITADCPLIDPGIVDQVVNCHKAKNVDLTYTSGSNLSASDRVRESKVFPSGLDVEVISIDALKKAHELSSEPIDREHVIGFVYKHPELFEMAAVEPDNSLNRPQYHLSVDTKEDLEGVRRFYRKLKQSGEMLDVRDVIQFLDMHASRDKSEANRRKGKRNLQESDGGG